MSAPKNQLSLAQELLWPDPGLSRNTRSRCYRCSVPGLAGFTRLALCGARDLIRDCRLCEKKSPRSSPAKTIHKKNHPQITQITQIKTVDSQVDAEVHRLQTVKLAIYGLNLCNLRNLWMTFRSPFCDERTVSTKH